MDYDSITRDHAPEKLRLAAELHKNMTGAERILWHALKAKRLHGLCFRRQQPLFGFIADFYCHELRLVVEVDGAIHNSRVEYDQARDSVLNGQGLTVVRVTNEQVTSDLNGVLATILRAGGVGDGIDGGT